MTEKVEVNGEGRHDLYRALVTTPNEEGEAGDITWNFEKFVVARDGAVIARFSPTVKPDDPRVIDAIEGLL
jgi:glutathione peroxidase